MRAHFPEQRLVIEPTAKKDYSTRLLNPPVTQATCFETLLPSFVSPSVYKRSSGAALLKPHTIICIIANVAPFHKGKTSQTKLTNSIKGSDRPLPSLTIFGQKEGDTNILFSKHKLSFLRVSTLF